MSKSYKSQVKSQVMSQSWVTSHKSQAMSHKLQVTSHESQVTSHKSWATSHESQVTWVPLFSLGVRTCMFVEQRFQELSSHMYWLTRAAHCCLCSVSRQVHTWLGRPTSNYIIRILWGRRSQGTRQAIQPKNRTAESSNTMCNGFIKECDFILRAQSHSLLLTELPWYA